MLQEKEANKLARAKKAESRLKEKAVKQHQDFNEAVTLLRQHRMAAKTGRILIKRHYAALVADALGVENPGTSWYTCVHTHTHTHTFVPAPPVRTR